MSILITGTDTGVGKTIVAGLLGRYFEDNGRKVITQKWVQTGSKQGLDDIDCHLRLMKKTRRDIEEFLPYILPYNFKFASSPHLAAGLEKKPIKPNKIKKSFAFLDKNFDFVIVEMTGGALVPFNKKSLLIDIAKELKLPTVIVVGNKLGAINHTLLTIEALKKRRIRILGLIFNNLNNDSDKIILKDNPKIIERISGQKVLGVLPYSKDGASLYKNFIPISRKIFNFYK